MASRFSARATRRPCSRRCCRRSALEANGAVLLPAAARRPAPMRCRISRGTSRPRSRSMSDRLGSPSSMRPGGASCGFRTPASGRAASARGARSAYWSACRSWRRSAYAVALAGESNTPRCRPVRRYSANASSSLITRPSSLTVGTSTSPASVPNDALRTVEIEPSALRTTGRLFKSMLPGRRWPINARISGIGARNVGDCSRAPSRASASGSSCEKSMSGALVGRVIAISSSRGRTTLERAGGGASSPPSRARWNAAMLSRVWGTPGNVTAPPGWTVAPGICEYGVRSLPRYGSGLDAGAT
ncbi:Hypothetical protein I5071_9650 [Sandaracinus amylolyticus]|nr:Hypothetical protein I5071_9650 [Sandaracinus amylolyticus]